MCFLGPSSTNTEETVRCERVQIFDKKMPSQSGNCIKTRFVTGSLLTVMMTSYLG